MALLGKTDLVAKFNRIQKDTGLILQHGNWISQLEYTSIEFMEKLFESKYVEEEMEGENEDDQVDVELNERFEALDANINRMLELCHPIAPQYIGILLPVVANMMFLKQIDFDVFEPALKNEALKMTTKFQHHVSTPEYASGSLNLRIDKLAEFVDNQRKHSEFHMSEIGYFIPMSSRRTMLQEVKKKFSQAGGGKSCCASKK